MSARAAPVMAEKVKRLTPLFNRVLVKKAEAIKQTASGLHIPEHKKSEFQKATVLAVGTGSQTNSGDVVPCCLKVGDEVILPDYGGTPVQFSENDDGYFLYREPDILAKINK